MRILVLTPSLSGADGVAEVSRQAVAALTPAACPAVRALDIAALDATGRLRWVADVLRRGAHGTTILVLHLHLLPVTIPLALAGARVFVLLHGIEAWKPLTKLQAAALRLASGLCAVSRFSAEKFKAANPAFAAREISIVHPAAPRRSSPSALLSHHDTALIVGRMSRKERYKGHDELLDVWPEVRARVPGARLVIVGGGDDRARLEAKARGAGLSDAVRFMGPVSDDQLAMLYANCAFYVMPSAREGFGLVYLEAMQAGKPCIAAKGAAEEIVEHERTGLIVDAADRDALIGAIVRLFGNAPLRHGFGTAGAERAARVFTTDEFRRRLQDVLGIEVPVMAC